MTRVGAGAICAPGAISASSMISPSAQRRLSSFGDAPAQIASSAMPSSRTVSFTKPWWMARNATQGGCLQSGHRHGVAACSSALPPIPAVTWTTCDCGFVRS